MKNIILIGAPGAGKSVVKSLLLKGNLLDPVVRKNLRFRGNPVVSYANMNDPSVGHLADYRKELTIATDRVYQLTRIPKLFPQYRNVFTHSLIDSVVYPTVRLYNMLNSGAVNDEELFRWEMVLHMNAQLMKDTQPDLPTLFISGNEGSSFAQDIETAIRAIIVDWKLPAVELTSAEAAATMLINLWKEEDGFTDPDLSSDEVAEESSNQDD